MALDFYQKMRIVCMRIPRGCVATYGQIALLCGAPNHSRQVGFGLKHNLAGEDVPAHRVVNGRGALSGARHFEFEDLQRSLLASEGVLARWNGREWHVNLQECGWKTTLQDALELELCFADAKSEGEDG